MTEHVDAGEGHAVISNPLSVRLAASFGGALITLVAAAITSAILPSTIGGLMFVVLGVPLVVYSAVRGLRISLVADRDEIVVRNYFRTHYVRWEDIQAIGIGFHPMGGVPLDAIVFQRRSRRSVSAQATTSNSRERRRVLDALRKMRPELPIRYSMSV